MVKRIPMDFPPSLAIRRNTMYNSIKEVDAMNINNPVAEETRTEQEQAFIAEIDALIEENLPALKELAK